MLESLCFNLGTRAVLYLNFDCGFLLLLCVLVQTVELIQTITIMNSRSLLQQDALLADFNQSVGANVQNVTHQSFQWVPSLQVNSLITACSNSIAY